jgi:hypothetical protein
VRFAGGAPPAFSFLCGFSESVMQLDPSKIDKARAAVSVMASDLPGHPAMVHLRKVGEARRAS